MGAQDAGCWKQQCVSDFSTTDSTSHVALAPFSSMSTHRSRNFKGHFVLYNFVSFLLDATQETQAVGRSYRLQTSQQFGQII